MISFAKHDLLRVRAALCVVLNHHQLFDVSQDQVIPGPGIGTVRIPDAVIEDNVAKLVRDMLYALHVKCNVEESILVLHFVRENHIEAVLEVDEIDIDQVMGEVDVAGSAARCFLTRNSTSAERFFVHHQSFRAGLGIDGKQGDGT